MVIHEQNEEQAGVFMGCLGGKKKNNHLRKRHELFRGDQSAEGASGVGEMEICSQNS